jgi:hypothetical protein
MSDSKVILRILRHAAIRSWKRFKTLGEIVTNIIYVVAAFVVLHFTTKELGDFVIYWALAIPPLLWWVYFICYAVKFFHRINPGTFPTLVIILLFVSVSFGVLYGIQLSLNAKLKHQLNPPKPPIVTPLKIPNPLPAETIPFQKPFVETQTSQPLHLNTESNNESESPIDSLKREKRGGDVVQQISNDEKVQIWWKNALKYYEPALISLSQALDEKSKASGDKIETTPGFFKCLPLTLKPEMVGITLGKIGFKNNTNMTFEISIKPDSSEQRPLVISCGCGLLEMHPDPSQPEISTYIKVPELEYTFGLKIGDDSSFSDKGIRALVDAQMKDSGQPKK